MNQFSPQAVNTIMQAASEEDAVALYHKVRQICCKGGFQLTKSPVTDSFINALWRFTARHGQVKEPQSDNVTKFVVAQRELKEVIEGWN